MVAEQQRRVELLRYERDRSIAERQRAEEQFMEEQRRNCERFRTTEEEQRGRREDDLEAPFVNFSESTDEERVSQDDENYNRSLSLLMRLIGVGTGLFFIFDFISWFSKTDSYALIIEMSVLSTVFGFLYMFHVVPVSFALIASKTKDLKIGIVLMTSYLIVSLLFHFGEMPNLFLFISYAQVAFSNMFIMYEIHGSPFRE